MRSPENARAGDADRMIFTEKKKTEDPTAAPALRDFGGLLRRPKKRKRKAKK